MQEFIRSNISLGMKSISMARSTAKFIAYDVRPAKQTERRGIVEFLNCAKHAGFDVSNYRYVGFGGTKFIDFQLMERYVGFKKYRSIEHDAEIFNRCKFNKPFNSIEMFDGPLSVFLSTDTSPENSVYWLDFEIGLNGELFSNLNSIASRAKDGDIILVTIKADLPRGKSTVKHLLKSRLPSLSTLIELDLGGLQKRNFQEPPVFSCSSYCEARFRAESMTVLSIQYLRSSTRTVRRCAR
jgi:hypothetical protein